MPSFAEIQARLKTASLRDLVVVAGGGVNGLSFNAVAALRERFLDVAFDDNVLTMEERSLAAAWARAVDSVLMLMLEEHPDTREGYVRAREAGRDQRLRFGYGSSGYLAAGGRQEAPADQMREWHAQLLTLAFFFPASGAA